MIFNTWIFGVFLLATVILYWLTPRAWRHIFLLLASFLFYAYYFPPYMFLILIIAYTIYGLALLMKNERYSRWQKIIFIMGITLCLAILFYYKYTKMAIRTWNDMAEWFGGTTFSIPEILVPLGLSFFIFEFIHFLVDYYRGQAPKISITEFGLFAMFFPTLVAGPIKRLQPFIDQLRNIQFRWEHFTVGLHRIIIGFGKKVLIADPMNHFLDPFANPYTASDIELYTAVLAYTIKIYADFSGYSDIAIGTARLFGYQVPENFDYPYLQPNIAAFWNHWHMSLSSWIRDYIYIPLGGNRGSLWFAIRNSLIAMGLSGLWHGASWNFVVWGLWHGVGIGALRVWRYVLKRQGIDVKRFDALKPLAILATFCYASVGWIFFVVTDIGIAIYITERVLQLK